MFLTKLMHNWNKTITIKMKTAEIFKKYKKDTINDKVYVENIS